MTSNNEGLFLIHAAYPAGLSSARSSASPPFTWGPRQTGPVSHRAWLVVMEGGKRVLMSHVLALKASAHIDWPQLTPGARKERELDWVMDGITGYVSERTA